MIGPETWGPHGWKFIHYVTLGYPDKPTNQDKKKYKIFLTLIKDVLPCNICANHYANNIKKLQLTEKVMSSRDTLVKWGIDLHNIVNRSKNKLLYSYDDALKIINADSKCVANIAVKQNNGSTLFKLIGILCALVLIAVVYKKDLLSKITQN